MLDRIKENEERLDNINNVIKDLNISLDKFKNSKIELDLLNKYYTSKNWIKDKDKYEKDSLNIKAGVLSEDAIWNMNEDIKDLLEEMGSIIELFNK